MPKLDYDFSSMTREQALAALVELDVARWGETERESSRRINAAKTRGLLINSIVHHHQHDYGDAFAPAAKELAKRQLTADDKAYLRQGG